MFKKEIIGFAALAILGVGCGQTLDDGLSVYGRVFYQDGEPVRHKPLKGLDIEVRIMSKKEPRNLEKDVLLSRRFGETNTGGTITTDDEGYFYLNDFIDLKHTDEKMVCHDFCVDEQYERGNDGKPLLDENNNPITYCRVWAQDCGWEEYLVNSSIRDIRNVTPYIIYDIGQTELRTVGKDVKSSNKLKKEVRKDTYQDLLDVSADFHTMMANPLSGAPHSNRQPLKQRIPIRFTAQDVAEGSLSPAQQAKLESARKLFAEASGKNKVN